MAKNKHKRLATRIEEIIDQIDAFYRAVTLATEKAQPFTVRLLFYEPYTIVDRPEMTLTAQVAMFHTHYVNLKILSPNRMLRDFCSRLPVEGAVLEGSAHPSRSCLSSTTPGKWWVPWKVMTTTPERLLNDIERAKQRAFLFCSIADDEEKHTFWFQNEETSSSLVHQLIATAVSTRQTEQLIENLNQDVTSLWIQTRDHWMDGSSDSDQMDVIPTECPDFKGVDFVPQERLSVRLAYEKVLLSIYNRKYQHLHHLRQQFKRALETAIFHNVAWKGVECENFFTEWHAELLDRKRTQKQVANGRWKQCQTIDEVTAARFIRYFADCFIADPSNKKMGEIACLLWLQVQIAQQSDEPIAIKDLLQITSKQLSSGTCQMIFGETSITISWGLLELLFLLRGNGEGKYGCLLFTNLNEKALERAFLEASKKLLPANATPVLPGAFLIFPHLMQGMRLSPTRRKSLRSNKPLRRRHG